MRRKGNIFNGKIEISAKDIAKDIAKISEAIRDNRLQRDRLAALRDHGYTIRNVAMGSGGVGQVRVTKDEIFVQVTCGIGRHNYADCVVLGK